MSASDAHTGRTHWTCSTGHTQDTHRTHTGHTRDTHRTHTRDMQHRRCTADVIHTKHTRMHTHLVAIGNQRWGLGQAMYEGTQDPTHLLGKSGVQTSEFVAVHPGGGGKEGVSEYTGQSGRRTWGRERDEDRGRSRGPRTFLTEIEEVTRDRETEVLLADLAGLSVSASMPSKKKREETGAGDGRRTRGEGAHTWRRGSIRHLGIQHHASVAHR